MCQKTLHDVKENWYDLIIKTFMDETFSSTCALVWNNMGMSENAVVFKRSTSVSITM